MKIMDVIKDKTVWIKGLVIGVISIALTYIFSLFNLPKLALTFSTIEINVRDQIAQGISPTLGGKALSLIGGWIPFTIPNMIVIAISAALTFMVGSILIETIKALPQGKNAVQKMAWTLLYGTIVTTAILSMSLAAVTVPIILTLGVYYIIIAIIMGQLEKNKVLNF